MLQNKNFKMAETDPMDALDQAFESLRLESFSEESYLVDAISEIPGSTRGDKFNFICKLVKKIALEFNKEKTDFRSLIKSHRVHTKLVPMISVLVGLQLKDHCSIITALKSEDANVVRQTLRAKWFFNASNKEIMNYEYFSTQVLPFISLKTLKLFIGALSRNLPEKECATAEHFFTGILHSCGIETALPLLVACNEKFILPAIIQHKIVLTNKYLSRIFQKYPNVVIEYLQLGNPSKPPERSGFKIDIHSYVNFLPALITDYPDKFAELVVAVKNLKIKNLGVKRTIMFMKAKQIFIEEPKFFIDHLQLKEVCKRLKSEELKSMFKKLFPDSLLDFNVDKMLDYLKYYDKNKVKLLTDTFKDVYGEDFYNMKERLTLKFLQELSANERLVLIRKILMDSPDWNIEGISGRTFLPVDEALASFKYELSKHPLEFDKVESIGKGISLCCKINDNIDALQETLEYVHGTCKDTTFDVNILSHVFHYWGVSNLNPKHQDIIVVIVDKLNEYVFSSLEPIEQILHYCLLNDLTLVEDKVLCVVLKVAIKHKLKLDLLRQHPDLERKCLQKIMSMVPKMYPVSKFSADHDAFITLVFDAVYSFNERITKSKSELAKLSIQEYPWLMDEFENILNSTKITNIDCKKRKRTLLQYDSAVYVTMFPDESVKLLNPAHALALLISDHNLFEKNWNSYLRMLNYIFSENVKSQFGAVKRLIRAMPWYGNILGLVRESVQEFYQHPQKQRFLEKGMYKILGVLYDGEKYTAMLAGLLNNNFDGIMKNKDCEPLHDLAAHALVAAKLCNPPVSLNLIQYFCRDNYLSEALSCSEHICMRVSAEKIEDFAQELFEKSLLWKIHAIHMLSNAPPSEEIYEYLANLWRCTLDSRIRSYLALETRRLFVQRPNESTLFVMMNCLTSLKPEHMEIFHKFADLKGIPDTRIFRYTMDLLNEIDGFGEAHKKDASKLISEIFESIDANLCLAGPESLWFHLCEKYIFRKDLGLSIAESGRRFLIDVYLLQAESKLKTRLTLLQELFRNIAENSTDLFWSKDSPIRTFVHSFVEKVHGNKEYFEVANGLFEAFSASITPQQARWEFLMLLFCREQIKAENTNEFGKMLVQKERFLVDLSPENAVDNVAVVLLDFLNFFGKSKLNMTAAIAEELLNSDSIFKTALISRLFEVQDQPQDVLQHTSFKDILGKKIET